MYITVSHNNGRSIFDTFAMVMNCLVGVNIVKSLIHFRHYKNSTYNTRVLRGINDKGCRTSGGSLIALKILFIHKCFFFLQALLL